MRVYTGVIIVHVDDSGAIRRSQRHGILHEYRWNSPKTLEKLDLQGHLSAEKPLDPPGGVFRGLLRGLLAWIH